MAFSANHNIIFLHIPKNGGNTLHSILDRTYPKEKTFSIRVVDNIKLNTADFINLPLEQRSKIKLLKGHMVYGLHKHLVGPSQYITFLRKPEARIISFYHYVKNRPHHRLFKELTENNMTLLDFVVSSTQSDLNNAQIRWISGLQNATEEEMLKKAIENIDNHFSFVGLQEHFDISLILLSKLYGWGIPYYKHLNKGKHHNSSKILDTETKKAIAEQNVGDIKLYEYIEEKFLKDVKKTKGLAFDLKKLHLINKLHSSYKLKKIRKLFNI